MIIDNFKNRTLKIENCRKNKRKFENSTVTGGILIPIYLIKKYPGTTILFDFKLQINNIYICALYLDGLRICGDDTGVLVYHLYKWTSRGIQRALPGIGPPKLVLISKVCPYFKAFNIRIHILHNPWATKDYTKTHK